MSVQNLNVQKGLKIDDIPKDRQFSQKEFIKSLSVGNGQGFKRCACTGKCINNRCKCIKNKLKCNSACHNSKSYSNYD